MGLKKFEGDDRKASDGEIDAWVAAIEQVNRSTSTIFFSITPFDQCVAMAKKHGYTTTENLFLHKRWKSDKVKERGFVSSVLQVVVG